MKFLFSQPTAPRGKFTSQDIYASLIRLGISLLLVLGAWSATDLSAVVGSNGEGIPYLAAVAYSIGNLIQAIAREIQSDQQKDKP